MSDEKFLEQWIRYSIMGVDPVVTDAFKREAKHRNITPKDFKFKGTFHKEEHGIVNSIDITIPMKGVK